MARQINYKHFTAPDGMCYCTKHKDYDLAENFPNCKKGPNGKHWWCTACVKKHNAKRSDSVILYQKRRNYGISEKDYLDRWNRQGGVCAICGNPETKIYKGKQGTLQVDHNHQNGEIRGLLCSACNTGLGSFRDDLHLLQAAITYLENTDGERTQNHRTQICKDDTERIEKMLAEVTGKPKYIKGTNSDMDDLPLFLPITN